MEFTTQGMLSLVAPTTENIMPEPLASWRGHGMGGRQPCSWTSEGGGCCRNPGAVARGSQSCPGRH